MAIFVHQSILELKKFSTLRIQVSRQAAQQLHRSDLGMAWRLRVVACDCVGWIGRMAEWCWCMMMSLVFLTKHGHLLVSSIEWITETWYKQGQKYDLKVDMIGDENL